MAVFFMYVGAVTLLLGGAMGTIVFTTFVGRVWRRRLAAREQQRKDMLSLTRIRDELSRIKKHLAFESWLIDKVLARLEACDRGDCVLPINYLIQDWKRLHADGNRPDRVEVGPAAESAGG